MNALRSLLHRTALLVVPALAAMVLAGCSKKITSVDAGYTTPEGEYSADARLIVYPDRGFPLLTMFDVPPAGPSDLDYVVDSTWVSTLENMQSGVILDGTDASAFQVLRREANGGYAQLNDFTLSPVAKFLDSHWEIYTFSDYVPSSFRPPSYMGRGLVDGQVTRTSPLTNVGEAAQQSIADIRYTAYPLPTDSLFTMTWTPATGAAGYWIQIYTTEGDATQEMYVAGRPAPFLHAGTANFLVHNFFVAYLPAPAGSPSYRIGDSEATIFFRRTMVMGAAYSVRISAVNSRGEMIGYSYGDRKTVPLTGTGTYYAYRGGAFVVTPSR